MSIRARIDSYLTEAERRRPKPKSDADSQWVAAWLGIALGVTLTLCFITGVLSHFIQHPPAWFNWPSRPAGLYRITQGIHVASGLASIPLLLAKLWTVYPNLFKLPPFKSFAHFVERISLIPLIGGALFQLYTGTTDIAHWYPYPFNFVIAHYWGAWITMGALIVHLGAKWAVTWHQVRNPPPLVASPQIHLWNLRIKRTKRE